MKILIYGINFSPELIGIGKYTGEMGVWLGQQGHEVRIITAPPYYPNWRVWKNFSKWFYNRKVNDGAVVWRCPLFVPPQPKTLLRILHLVSFAVTSMPILIGQVFWRPNLVFLVAPTLFCAPGALLLAKLVAAKSILHIQDYETDALFGLNLTSDRPRVMLLKNLAFSIESLMLRNFDLVSTISDGMMQRARDKGVALKCLRYLPNWSELDRFYSAKPSVKLLDQLGVGSDKKIVLYSGNMGEKQGLENVILAAQQLQKIKNLVFLLVGDGGSKNRLMGMATDLRLSNLMFAPLQSYENLPALLASAHIHLVVQKRGAADAVLPSKLTNILAVGGNALITADASTTLGKLPTAYPGVALVVEPESVDALVLGIMNSLSMTRPNRIAQKYAEEFLDKEQVLSTFFAGI